MRPGGGFPSFPRRGPKGERGAGPAGRPPGVPAGGAPEGAAPEGTDDPVSRILGRDELLRRYGRPRDFELVFTNGCFDLLHPGHASLLRRARGLGDRLVVGLNSDGSVRRIKGEGRPLMPERDRAYLLASLRWVDAVTVFEEDTPEALLGRLLPEHYVKGADWSRELPPGGDLVEAAGGTVHLLPLEEGRSTSELLRRLRGPGDPHA